MLIIPVLDISRGLVVHAKKGEREHYKAISSIISPTPEPIIVIKAFLKLYPFKIIYIADLDAIQGSQSQSTLINSIALQFGQCEFWVDAGLKVINNCKAEYTAQKIKMVLGSENKLPRKILSGLLSRNQDILLSLDFSENGLIENDYLLDEVALWTPKIIVMMLHRVGSTEGIDYPCLDKVLAMAKKNEIYSAGGAQNCKDLIKLGSIGIKGVLLATSLHNGSITSQELKQFLDK
jgi:phosphoribosylformimino-5-aminoimidazole carboxamide ribotide isomerase